MYEFILTIHIIVCVLLVIVILIQTGKGGGIGGIFGGGGAETLFSTPSGSAFIRKLTAGFAAAFVLTSVLLTELNHKRTGRSVLEKVGIPGQTQQGGQ